MDRNVGGLDHGLWTLVALTLLVAGYRSRQSILGHALVRRRQ